MNMRASCFKSLFKTKSKKVCFQEIVLGKEIAYCQITVNVVTKIQDSGTPPASKLQKFI